MIEFIGMIALSYSGDTAGDRNLPETVSKLSAKLFADDDAKWKSLKFDFQYPEIQARQEVCFDLYNWSSQFDDLMLYHIDIKKVEDTFELTGGVILKMTDTVEYFEINGFFK